MRQAIQSTVCGIAVLFVLALNITTCAASDSLVRGNAGSLAAHRSDAGQLYDLSAQRRRYNARRAPARVRVYRGYSSPGPNAVRICNAYYVQEYRASGTVIVPRMSCYWRG